MVTLAKGEVAALPITDEYTSLLSRLTENGLTKEGPRQVRNEAALEQQGKKVAIQALAKEAASEWWWRMQGWANR